MVEATQADREAAAAMLRKIDLPFYADEAAEGQADHSAAVQAFAAHRISSLSGVEELVEALEPFARVRFSRHARNGDFMEVMRRLSSEERAERIALGHPPLGQSPKEMCSLDGLTVKDFRNAAAALSRFHKQSDGRDLG